MALDAGIEYSRWGGAHMEDAGEGQMSLGGCGQVIVH